MVYNTEQLLDILNFKVSRGMSVPDAAADIGLVEIQRNQYERETCDTAILYRSRHGVEVTGWITRNTDGTPRNDDGFDTEKHPFEQ